MYKLGTNVLRKSGVNMPYEKVEFLLFEVRCNYINITQAVSNVKNNIPDNSDIII